MSHGASELVSCDLLGINSSGSCPSRDGSSPCGDTPGSSHSKSSMRGKILALEAAMKAMGDAKPGELGQITIPIEHHFAPGIYLREMRMPQGSTVVGMIHKTEHLSFMSKGKILLVTEDFKSVVEAPTVIHSMPGAKRVLHALEDSVWTTVHPNPDNEKNPEKLWDRFVVDTFEQFEAYQREQIQEESLWLSLPQQSD